MDLADIKICKPLIINVFYFANSLNSYISDMRVVLLWLVLPVNEMLRICEKSEFCEKLFRM